MIEPRLEQPPASIAFYLPFRRDGVSELPASADDYWAWICPRRSIGEGKYSWTLQTYLNLREAGVPCTLTERFPEQGIVVSHRDFLPVFLPPRADVFLVCVKPDRKEHTWANWYIAQNASDSIHGSRKGRGRTSTLPFWPQPSLRPRAEARQALCRNVAYIGRTVNLAPELKAPSWKDELAELGFEWRLPSLEAWNDYSELDVTISVRSFEQAHGAGNPLLHQDSKPPSKLINSWLAGVPAIVGAESAYRAIRVSDLDYIEVNSPAELKSALQELRNRPDLYRAMVERGRERAREFSRESVTEMWRRALEGDIAAAYEKWRTGSRARRMLSNGWGVAEYFCKPQNIIDLLRALSPSLKRA